MKPTREWKTTKLPPHLHASLKAHAAQNGMALADLMEIIVIDWFRRQGLPSPPALRVTTRQTDLFLQGLPTPDEPPK